MRCCWLRQRPGSQDAPAFSAPLTFTAGGTYSHRSKGSLAEPLSPAGVGFRALVYPTARLGKGWYAAGAVQVRSRRMIYEQLDEPAGQPKIDVIQAALGYERYWGKNFFGLRAGVMPTAFGSFALRYDDSVNPLIDVPVSSGYYYKNVTTLGLTGAQIDATFDKLDLRVRASTSSPANRRGPFQSDQYLSWTGGASWTFFQGLRVGVSAYRGPYLDRGYRFFRPGEIRPKDLPATGYGVDVQFARGHWNVQAELQRFQKAYTAIPTFEQVAGYGEVKYAFRPRWFVAFRGGHEQGGPPPTRTVLEGAVGYRVSPRQLVKAGYQAYRGPATHGALGDVIGVQWVTRLDGVDSLWN
ncbi:MAG: hypothetical protein R2748_31035 [Bryobacterales bacterium]